MSYRTGATAAFGTGSTTSLESPLEDYHQAEFDPLLGRPYSAMASEPVFPLIQRVRNEVANVIDTVLSYEQLKTPAINFSVVRPLTAKFSSKRPPAPLLYALLVNRTQFITEADEELAFAGVNTTRADLCELLAIKLLSAYGTAPASLELLHVLTHNFNSFEGVTQDMFPDDGDGPEDINELLQWGKLQSANALELAIFSKAKRFVRSALVQQVIASIYKGEISYRPEGGSHALLSDDYKSKPVVEVYDWRKEPFLDHYRLRVPMIRNRIEFATFTSIILLFLLTESTRTNSHITLWEALFILWSMGFCLDEVASIRENGLAPYFFSVYNVLDSIFCAIFLAFLALRFNGLVTGDVVRSELAFDTLSLSACILFPRLSISLLRGNIVLLALSAMVKEFVFFMMLVSLCASGFLCSFYVLAYATGQWGIGRISWLMFKIWLGNSFLGFEAAQEFHPIFGPLLIVFFAILSQTLLLTILISLLSNTFAAVQANAETEILNQNALRTIERVKSDALTSYSPPLNVFAFIILLVAKPFLSPRFFHKVNVFLVKAFNLPVLLILALHTRIHHRHSFGRASVITAQTRKAWNSLPRGLAWEGAVEGVSKIFEHELTEAAIVVPALDTQDTEAESVHAPEPPARSRTRGRGLARGRALPSQHARMGSMGSPLAKMFTLPEERPIVQTPPATPRKADSGQVEIPKSVVERLEAIESALAILVGEVTSKNPDGEPPKSTVPLTSLSGAIEQSYADKD
ncbi:hypothetical protein T439DRAFT_322080 [Meredithblackwellia eburnea MCA 4105]